MIAFMIGITGAGIIYALGAIEAQLRQINKNLEKNK